ncbi:MAG: exostosin family protein [Patescibacteria group bacterium]
MKQPISFLTLYVNPAWRRIKDVPSSLLFPFWGNLIPESSFLSKEFFNSFSFDIRFYGITDDITKADAVFAPYRQATMMRHDPALLAECAQTAKGAGLPLFVDGMGDGETPLGIDNACIMRYGGYRTLKEELGRNRLPVHLRFESPNIRIQVPTQVDDLLMRCQGGVFSVRHKGEEKPVVSFAGMVKTTFKNTVHQRLNELPLYLRGILDDRYFAMSNGIFLRSKALRILERSKRLVCKFEGQFFSPLSPRRSHDEMKTFRRGFVETILESDYCIDVRGYGNASYRLYEILSLGRIPVIIDTERHFPFSDVVDWRKFSLIVDFRDIKRLPDIIADFHASISPEEFETMQREARAAYINCFRIDAQMPYIIREFNKLRSAFDHQ